MHLFDIPEKTVELLQNQTFGPQHFASQTDKSLKMIIEFCRIINLRKNIGFHILPEHIYKDQIEATREEKSYLFEQKRRENIRLKLRVLYLSRYKDVSYEKQIAIHHGTQTS